MPLVVDTTRFPDKMTSHTADDVADVVVVALAGASEPDW